MLLHWLGSVGEVVEPPLDWDRMTFGADIVGSTAVPTNLGAGTNETRLVMYRRAAVYREITEPLVDKYSANAADSATIVVVARRYLAFKSSGDPPCRSSAGQEWPQSLPDHSV